MKKLLKPEDFIIEIELPSPKEKPVFLTVTETGRVNLCGKLAAQLSGKFIGISMTADHRHIAIFEKSEDNGVRVPKNGSIKWSNVTDTLEKSKIQLPARFEIQYIESNHFWQGDMIENPTSEPSEKRRSVKKH